MYSQIQIDFPRPGHWEQFRMTALLQDAEGFILRRHYGPSDIPAEQLPTMQRVVQSLVALDEPWQATHVTGQLVVIEAAPESAEAHPPYEQIQLTIHARREDGARRSFTHADYPQLRLADAASIAFFKHFTHSNP